MLQAFTNFIRKEKLISPGGSALLAVSGGIDSVVMAHLFSMAPFKFAIAHCNFMLRDSESDLDEAFVRKLAADYKTPFYSKRFATREYAKKRSISVQMAARDLRYGWFEQIRLQQGYDCIATAHHRDDQTETFFINLARGCGIQGLHGILPGQGNIIRPMLFSTRSEIESHATAFKLEFREDASNHADKYLRNRIRHSLIPFFTEMNPDFSEGMTRTITRLREFEQIGEQVIEEKRRHLVRQSGEQFTIGLEPFMALRPPAIWAWELLSPFGFNESQIHDILRGAGETGTRKFLSPGYRLVIERTQLVITPRTSQKQETKIHVLNDLTRPMKSPLRLKFRRVPKDPAFTIITDPGTANLDAAKLTYPLTLRRWIPGDAFHPFGMNKNKKLSDFFIDQKCSVAEKENTWLLCSGNHIVWVIGHRIDNRYRVTSRTKEVLVAQTGH